MNLRGLVLTLVMLLMAASPARAEESPVAPGVRVRLQSPAMLRGEFEQNKQLQGFRRPLSSRGRFVLVRGRGVIWDTREPFASVVVVTGDRVLEQLDGGEQRVVLDRAESPGAAVVNALLLALVGGDLEALSRSFTLREQVPAQGDWTLVLEPREAALRQVFERIELSGDRHVRRVHLQERSGDTSEITFSKLDDAPAVLSADEARRLD